MFVLRTLRRTSARVAVPSRTPSLTASIRPTPPCSSAARTCRTSCSSRTRCTRGRPPRRRDEPDVGRERGDVAVPRLVLRRRVRAVRAEHDRLLALLAKLLARACSQPTPSASRRRRRSRRPDVRDDRREVRVVAATDSRSTVDALAPGAVRDRRRERGRVVVLRVDHDDVLRLQVAREKFTISGAWTKSFGTTRKNVGNCRPLSGRSRRRAGHGRELRLLEQLPLRARPGSSSADDRHDLAVRDELPRRRYGRATPTSCVSPWTILKFVWFACCTAAPRTATRRAAPAEERRRPGQRPGEAERHVRARVAAICAVAPAASGFAIAAAATAAASSPSEAAMRPFLFTLLLRLPALRLDVGKGNVVALLTAPKQLVTVHHTRSRAPCQTKGG